MEPQWVIKRHPGLAGICQANGREGAERERGIENATLLCFMEGFGQRGTGLAVCPKAVLQALVTTPASSHPCPAL